MKPAVINNSSETPTQSHHEQSSQQTNNGQPNNDQSRRFPQFGRQHGFGFDDPDGDVFADMGLRSRLNRMGHPFDWSGRKRGGQGGGNADAYDHYFDDVDFPHFGSTWDAFGRSKRHPTDANDRSGFFNYVPQEFRQYVPEHFGGYFRQHSGQQPYMPQQQQQQPQSPSQQQQQQYQQAQQHPQQQQQPPAHHQQQTQPQSSQPSGSKSNLCDAAIQTDDSHIQNNSDNRNGMNQSNEFHHPNQYYQQPSANANYAGGPQYNRQYQQPYAQQYPQQHAPPQQQNRNYVHPSGAAAASAPPQQHPQSTPQEGYVRNVPIVFESTGTPINTRSGSGQTPPPPPQQQQAQQQQQPTGSAKPRPEPLNKDSFASNQPIPSDQPIPCPPPPAHNQQQQQQQPDQQQPHSESSNADAAAPPQTPHTADCISKIQAIQRDVLELMLRVEEFGGKRGDRDYMYLDEMLTRNLLKLDTIDTNGKDSIRMARKEAIKCIQTSIAVLEAKADLHLNEKRDSIDQTSQNQVTESSGDGAAVPQASASSEPTPAAESNQQNSAEKTDVEQAAPTAATNANDDGKATANGGDAGIEQQNSSDATATVAVSDELPKVENISIDEKPNGVADSSAAQNEPIENKSKDNSNKENTPETADAKQ